ITHRPSLIRFAVKAACNEGDGCPRNDLFYKNNAAANLTFRFALHIKAQIHFLKIYVERHEKIGNTRVKEHKCDQAYETFPVKKIYLRSRRNERREHARIDLVIHH